MFDIRQTFNENTDGLVLSACQTISGDHLDRLAEARDNSLNPLKSELQRVASVPTIVVERWRREGFDIYHEPARKIIARLRAESLDAFVTTKRRV